LIMKRTLVVLGLLVLCGCSQTYVMKMSNGSQISTPGKPKLKGAYYHYKDVRGEEHLVPQSRVLLIQPASMAEEDNKFTPQKPKTHHWWKFW
jgi:hypothetical protein